jgi:hypothetical protein
MEGAPVGACTTRLFLGLGHAIDVRRHPADGLVRLGLNVEGQGFRLVRLRTSG